MQIIIVNTKALKLDFKNFLNPPTKEYSKKKVSINLRPISNECQILFPSLKSVGSVDEQR